MNSSLLVRSTRTGLLSHRWQIVAGVTVMGAIALIAWNSGWTPVATSEQSSAELTQELEISSVTALGRLEPHGELIALTAPTSVQESRIAELQVAEGDIVETGQIIAVLDGRDRLQAALRQAEEQVRVAQAQLAQVQAGAKEGELQAQRAEIARIQADQTGQLATQRAAIARLEAEVQNARLEYERYESLYQEGAISASERDARQLTYDTAQRQLEESQAEFSRLQTTSQEQVQQARSTLDQLAEVRPVDVAVAEAELWSAQAAVTEAEANLEQLYVRSPQDGQIIEIHTHPGETIASEGIVTLGQTQQMMAIAEVYQTDIPDVQVGQSATITSPVLEQELRGTVERIGLQVGQQRVVDEDPAANIDARVVDVQIQLDPESSAIVAGLANLQVTVSIQTQ